MMVSTMRAREEFMVPPFVLFVAVAFLDAASAASWNKGEYSKLSVAADGRSYTFSFGTTVLTSHPDSLANATGPGMVATGADAQLGAYEQLSIPFHGGALAVRYFTAMDAFVFVRLPKPATDPEGGPPVLPTVWPKFSVADQPRNHTRCLGWSEHYFYPGGIATDILGCSSGGPLFLFDPPPLAPALPVPAMVLSPLSHFSSNQVVNCPPHNPKLGPPDISLCALGVDASAECGRSTHCQFFETEALVMARPGLTRATRAFGSILRLNHNTTRNRGPAVKELSYWNDNQAGYSWWTAGPDQAIWGTPEDIYVKLKEGYDEAGIPIRGWEPDNNFVVDYKPIKNWIGVDWNKFEEMYYPSGGDAWVQKMGNISMTYYTNGFDKNNTHQRTHPMVTGGGGMEPHPNTSLNFYTDLFKYNQEHFNMEHLFTDFLCYRGPSMAQYQDVPAGEEGEHMWLGGMSLAAQNLGMEVQYCMALAHQILESVHWGAVTNARANGDGGLAVEGLVLTSLLAATAGLGWSKDNLRTADKCYVNGTYPNGTVMWPCGSSNHGEGTSGKFTMQVQQTMLATLSLGPVGIADQLSGRPEDPSAKITSNKTLVMATCSTSGDLLQPSYPIVPIERMIIGAGEFGDCFGPTHRAYTYGCGTHAWATYTAVPVGTSNMKINTNVGRKSAGKLDIGLWWTAIGFFSGRGGAASPNVTLYETDLAPMVDASSLPSPEFGTIPTASFQSNGTEFPKGSWEGSGRHVVWGSVNGFVNQKDCTGIEPKIWSGSTTLQVAPSKMQQHSAGGDFTDQVNIAPLVGGVALLGEVGKVTAVSVFRFISVEPSGKGLEVKLRGKPRELVTLLFASTTSVETFAGAIEQGEGEALAAKSALKCSQVAAKIGPDGTGVAHFAP